jgi:hypothetical protein
MRAIRHPKGRPISDAERAALSPGLLRALGDAGAEPRLVDAAHPGARLVALWRGRAPILVRGACIYWPGAPEDLSGAGDRALAVLQHELQHVLDYALGELTGRGYLLRPRNWRYRYALTAASRWRDFGAEQRASIAEHHWLIERGRSDLVAGDLGVAPPDAELYRRILPWATPAALDP